MPRPGRPPEAEFVTPGGKAEKGTWACTNNVNYANPLRLSAEGNRICLFHRSLGAIDPQNTNVVYLSTDADIATGKLLISTADGRRHHEIFRSETTDDGATWQWTPVTANSTMDNLRPLVPQWKDERTALVWMRGSYEANCGEWTSMVVATLLKPADF